jgi:hypothetical protein
MRGNEAKQKRSIKMGYTHYWSFKKVAKGKAALSEKAYQKAILECAKIIRYYSETFGGLSGYSAHCEPKLYGGLKVNGSERVGSCEDFVMREHLSENADFEFCKTNQNPYDTVVTACLIVLANRLGPIIEVSSDGRRDDWNDGLILARKVLGLKRLDIPESIQPNRKMSQDEAS